MIAVVLLAFLLAGSKSSEKVLDKAVEPTVYPIACSKNQVPKPALGEEDKWTCHCKHGYLFYAPANDCFLAYHQGPCEVDQMFVFDFKAVAKCVVNPCKKDGLVEYKGTCYTLNTEGPCKNNQNGAHELRVNNITFELECFPSLSFRQLVKFPPNCPPNVTHPNCRPEY